SVGLRCRSTRPTTLDKVIAFRMTKKLTIDSGWQRLPSAPPHHLVRANYHKPLHYSSIWYKIIAI
ncbi:MAG TPA: hypothetical protein PKW57_04705, partial [Anaerolineaceae bacterium]|nr:hypothetical protein [Anaerolineaceae bacterium]